MEITVYLLLAVLSSSIRHVLSGIKNAAFYARGTSPIHPVIQWFVQNIHRAETPAWYSQAGILFFCLLALYRMEGQPFGIALGGSALLTMGASGIAGPFRQGFINWGVGRPFVDKNENPKAEFALGPISFWFPRPWGLGRFAGVILGCWFVWLGLRLLVL